MKLTEFQKWCQEVLPIVQAAANGETIEGRFIQCKEWVPADDTWECFAKSRVYRIKPRTIKVNGFDVPEPIRTKPADDTYYYIPSPTALSMCTELMWASDSNDERWLVLGICHSTAEAAIARAKAMLGIDPASK